MQTPSIYIGTIREITSLTARVFHVTCTLPTASNFHFVAGQYATVIIDPKTRRQYSFCSNPTNPREVSFLIDTAPGGPGSKFFQQKRVGDDIQFLGPLGTFVMHDSQRKKILVATGTGIAPFNGMIHLEVGATPITLYWGLRHETDIYWEQEFIDLHRQYPTFNYHIILSKPEGTWSGSIGHVTEYLVQEEPLEDNDYYLCGNRQMIADCQQLLLAHTVLKEQIYTEQF